MRAPASLGIRHVALTVRDLAAAERFWVDEAHMFILRQVIEADEVEEGVKAQVTKISYSAAPADVFRFQPPPGATQIP